MKRRSRILLFLLLALAVILAGCTLDQSPIGDQIDTPAGAELPSKNGQETQKPPTLSVSADTNCREGPGVPYKWLGGVMIGDEVEVVGWDGEGEYAVVINPDAPGECWVWLEYATVTGNLAAIPVVDAPPKPSFDWSGQWTMWINDKTYTGSLSVSGDKVSGEMDPGNLNKMTIDGTISQNGKVVNGMFALAGGGDGSFSWEMLPNLEQFVGNGVNGLYGWCGWRGISPAPSPCFGP